MNKKLSLVLFAMLIFLLTGCEKNELDYQLIIDQAIAEITFPDEVESDLSFYQSRHVQGVVLEYIWETSNEAISNTGVVVRGMDDVQVEITVTVKYQAHSKKQTIKTVTVLKIAPQQDDHLLEKALEKIVLPTQLSSDLVLLDYVDVDSKRIAIHYIFDNASIGSDGKIKPLEEEDVIVKVTCKVEYEDQFLEEVVAFITVLSYKTIIERAVETVVIPASTNSDILLVKKIGSVMVQWQSGNKKVLSDAGVCSYVSSDTKVKLYAFYYIDYSGGTYSYDEEYEVIITPYAAQTRYNLIIAKLNLPLTTVHNLNLPTTFDYDVTAQWSSSDPSVISDAGIVTPKEVQTTVTLTLLLSCQNQESAEYTYTVEVEKVIINEDEADFYKHNLIDRAKDYAAKRLHNLVLVDGKVKLAPDALTGTYESKIFNTLNFSSIVGSYACVTSNYATCEVEFSVRVNGVWSKYFTYGEWGLDKTNYYSDSSDAIAKLSTDEIIVSNSKTGDGIKYRVTLRRNNLSTQSPVLSMVSSALSISNYKPVVDVSSLPDYYDITVPALYQHDVPTIGSTICSATTTTMLLKYKGFSFADKGYQYEHQYIAYMVADPGHNNPTYGNWSYNMITAGAFGVDSYVARMYSWEEIQYHLVNVGPIGASIKGTFGIYTTNGHLIVVKGYKIDNGNTIVICNDPNVKGVYYEVTLETFMTCWRGVVYVVE